MVDDLVAFLRDRLDEDEAGVRALTVPHDWHTGPGDDPDWTDEELVCMWPPEFHTPYEQDKHWRGLTVEGPATAAHIARHDPARVLREVEAKRRILDDLLAAQHFVCDDHWFTCCAATQEHDGGTCPRGDHQHSQACTCGLADRTAQHVRTLAAVYADHPDYRPEWAPDA